MKASNLTGISQALIHSGATCYTTDISIGNRGWMETSRAVAAFGALAQDTRLRAVRLLLRNHPAGLPAGEIARRLGVPQNTLSAHLGILSRSGLVTSERRQRSIIYRADVEGFRALASYLAEDCCGARLELCVPRISECKTFSPGGMQDR